MTDVREQGIRLSSRMPAWIPLRLVPGSVILACTGLALHAWMIAEWRGALMLLVFLAVLSAMTFGLARYPIAERVLDRGDHVRIESSTWTGDIPLAAIEAVTFRPALNGRVVTLHCEPGQVTVPAWIFVPRLMLRAGIPREVEDLQHRIQRRRALAAAPGE